MRSSRERRRGRGPPTRHRHHRTHSNTRRFHKHRERYKTGGKFAPAASPSRFEQTHILFDLDNTLFFTAHCERHYGDTMLKTVLPLTNEEEKSARRLETLLIRVWRRVVGTPYRARVSIVTNGSEEWMHHVFRHHLKRFWRVLRTQQQWDQRHGVRFPTIQFVSARTRYETEHPNDYIAWKYYAFLDELYEPYFSAAAASGAARHAQQNTQILLFADGPVDKEAFDRVMNIFKRNRRHQSSVVAKLVTFVDVPSLSQLTREWEQVNASLDSWMQDTRALHIVLAP